jgi:hypothetical protein
MPKWVSEHDGEQESENRRADPTQEEPGDVHVPGWHRESPVVEQHRRSAFKVDALNHEFGHKSARHRERPRFCRPYLVALEPEILADCAAATERGSTFNLNGFAA